MIEKKLANHIRNNDRQSYLEERFPAIADYEELVFEKEDFSNTDWRNFPSSMNTFRNCVLDGVILSPGQPIRIENCSAKGLDIRGAGAIIHAVNSDFTGMLFDEETILANKYEPSDIPSSFESCVLDENARNFFSNQGAVINS